ncbi:hypothetical protein BgiMline_023860, partial [Biomphalaria glabrata]
MVLMIFVTRPKVNITTDNDTCSIFGHCVARLTVSCNWIFQGTELAFILKAMPK